MATPIKSRTRARQGREMAARKGLLPMHNLDLNEGSMVDGPFTPIPDSPYRELKSDASRTIQDAERAENNRRMFGSLDPGARLKYDQVYESTTLRPYETSVRNPADFTKAEEVMAAPFDAVSEGKHGMHSHILEVAGSGAARLAIAYQNARTKGYEQVPVMLEPDAQNRRKFLPPSLQDLLGGLMHAPVAKTNQMYPDKGSELDSDSLIRESQSALMGSLGSLASSSYVKLMAWEGDSVKNAITKFREPKDAALRESIVKFREMVKKQYTWPYVSQTAPPLPTRILASAAVVISSNLMPLSHQATLFFSNYHLTRHIHSAAMRSEFVLNKERAVRLPKAILLEVPDGDVDMFLSPVPRHVIQTGPFATQLYSFGVLHMDTDNELLASLPSLQRCLAGCRVFTLPVSHHRRHYKDAGPSDKHAALGNNKQRSKTPLKERNVESRAATATSEADASTRPEAEVEEEFPIFEEAKARKRHIPFKHIAPEVPQIDRDIELMDEAWNAMWEQRTHATNKDISALLANVFGLPWLITHEQTIPGLQDDAWLPSRCSDREFTHEKHSTQYSLTPDATAQAGPGEAVVDASILDITSTSIFDAAAATYGDAVGALKTAYWQGQMLSFSFLHVLSRRMPNLRHLIIPGCAVLNHEMCELLAQSPFAPNLLALNVSHCENVTDTGLVQILEEATHLRAIYIGGCPKLTNACLEAISYNNKQIHTVDVSWAYNIDDAGLHHLLARTRVERLSMRGLGRLQKAVLKIPKIPINIPKKKYGPDGRLLTTHIKSKIRAEEEEKIVPEYTGGLTGEPFMQQKHLGMKFELLASLHELDLESCSNVTDAVVQSIVQNAGGTLRKLKLNSLQLITNVSSTVIALYCPKLRELRLAYCISITAPLIDARYFPDLLRGDDASGTVPPSDIFSALQHFDISGSPYLSDADVEFALLRALNLTEMRVTSCDLVTGASLGIMTAVAKHSLKTLAFAYIQDLYDEDILTMLKSCKHVEVLDLTGCVNVTGAFLCDPACTQDSFTELYMGPCHLHLSQQDVINVCQRNRGIRVLQLANDCAEELHDCSLHSTEDISLFAMICSIGICCPMMKNLLLTGWQCPGILPAIPDRDLYPRGKGVSTIFPCLETLCFRESATLSYLQLVELVREAPLLNRLDASKSGDIDQEWVASIVEKFGLPVECVMPVRAPVIQSLAASATGSVKDGLADAESRKTVALQPLDNAKVGFSSKGYAMLMQEAVAIAARVETEQKALKNIRRLVLHRLRIVPIKSWMLFGILQRKYERRMARCVLRIQRAWSMYKHLRFQGKMKAARTIFHWVKRVHIVSQLRRLCIQALRVWASAHTKQLAVCMLLVASQRVASRHAFNKIKFHSLVARSKAMQPRSGTPRVDAEGKMRVRFNEAAVVLGESSAAADAVVINELALRAAVCVAEANEVADKPNASEDDKAYASALLNLPITLVELANTPLQRHVNMERPLQVHMIGLKTRGTMPRPTPPSKYFEDVMSRWAVLESSTCCKLLKRPASSSGAVLKDWMTEDGRKIPLTLRQSRDLALVWVARAFILQDSTKQQVAKQRARLLRYGKNLTNSSMSSLDVWQTASSAASSVVDKRSSILTVSSHNSSVALDVADIIRETAALEEQLQRLDTLLPANYQLFRQEDKSWGRTVRQYTFHRNAILMCTSCAPNALRFYRMRSKFLTPIPENDVVAVRPPSPTAGVRLWRTNVPNAVTLPTHAIASVGTSVVSEASHAMERYSATLSEAPSVRVQRPGMPAYVESSEKLYDVKASMAQVLNILVPIAAVKDNKRQLTMVIPQYFIEKQRIIESGIAVDRGVSRRLRQGIARLIQQAYRQFKSGKDAGLYQPFRIRARMSDTAVIERSIIKIQSGMRMLSAKRLVSKMLFVLKLQDVVFVCHYIRSCIKAITTDALEAARVLTFAAQASPAMQAALRVFTRLSKLYKEEFAVGHLSECVNYVGDIATQLAEMDEPALMQRDNVVSACMEIEQYCTLICNSFNAMVFSPPEDEGALSFGFAHDLVAEDGIMERSWTITENIDLMRNAAAEGVATGTNPGQMSRVNSKAAMTPKRSWASMITGGGKSSRDSKVDDITGTALSRTPSKAEMASLLRVNSTTDMPKLTSKRSATSMSPERSGRQTGASEIATGLVSSPLPRKPSAAGMSVLAKAFKLADESPVAEAPASKFVVGSGPPATGITETPEATNAQAAATPVVRRSSKVGLSMLVPKMSWASMPTANVATPTLSDESAPTQPASSMRKSSKAVMSIMGGKKRSKATVKPQGNANLTERFQVANAWKFNSVCWLSEDMLDYSEELHNQYDLRRVKLLLQHAVDMDEDNAVAVSESFMLLLDSTLYMQMRKTTMIHAQLNVWAAQTAQYRKWLSRPHHLSDPSSILRTFQMQMIVNIVEALESQKHAELAFREQFVTMLGRVHDQVMRPLVVKIQERKKNDTQACATLLSHLNHARTVIRFLKSRSKEIKKILIQQSLQAMANKPGGGAMKRVGTAVRSAFSLKPTNTAPQAALEASVASATVTDIFGAVIPAATKPTGYDWGSTDEWVIRKTNLGRLTYVHLPTGTTLFKEPVSAPPGFSSGVKPTGSIGLRSWAATGVALDDDNELPAPLDLDANKVFAVKATPRDRSLKPRTPVRVDDSNTLAANVVSVVSGVNSQVNSIATNEDFTDAEDARLFSELEELEEQVDTDSINEQIALVSQPASLVPVTKRGIMKRELQWITQEIKDVQQATRRIEAYINTIAEQRRVNALREQGLIIRMQGMFGAIMDCMQTQVRLMKEQIQLNAEQELHTFAKHLKGVFNKLDLTTQQDDIREMIAEITNQVTNTEEKAKPAKAQCFEQPIPWHIVELQQRLRASQFEQYFQDMVDACVKQAENIDMDAECEDFLQFVSEPILSAPTSAWFLRTSALLDESIGNYRVDPRVLAEARSKIQESLGARGSLGADLSDFSIGARAKVCEPVPAPYTFDGEVWHPIKPGETPEEPDPAFSLHIIEVHAGSEPFDASQQWFIQPIVPPCTSFNSKTVKLYSCTGDGEDCGNAAFYYCSQERSGFFGICMTAEQRDLQIETPENTILNEVRWLQTGAATVAARNIHAALGEARVKRKRDNRVENSNKRKNDILATNKHLMFSDTATESTKQSQVPDEHRLDTFLGPNTDVFGIHETGSTESSSFYVTGSRSVTEAGDSKSPDRHASRSSTHSSAASRNSGNKGSPLRVTASFTNGTRRMLKVQAVAAELAAIPEHHILAWWEELGVGSLADVVSVDKTLREVAAGILIVDRGFGGGPAYAKSNAVYEVNLAKQLVALQSKMIEAEAAKSSIEHEFFTIIEDLASGFLRSRHYTLPPSVQNAIRTSVAFTHDQAEKRLLREQKQVRRHKEQVARIKARVLRRNKLEAQAAAAAALTAAQAADSDSDEGAKHTTRTGTDGSLSGSDVSYKSVTHTAASTDSRFQTTPNVTLASAKKRKRKMVRSGTFASAATDDSSDSDYGSTTMNESKRSYTITEMDVASVVSNASDGRGATEASRTFNGIVAPDGTILDWAGDGTQFLLPLWKERYRAQPWVVDSFLAALLAEGGKADFADILMEAAMFSLHKFKAGTTTLPPLGFESLRTMLEARRRELEVAHSRHAENARIQVLQKSAAQKKNVVQRTLKGLMDAFKASRNAMKAKKVDPDKPKLSPAQSIVEASQEAWNWTRNIYYNTQKAMAEAKIKRNRRLRNTMAVVKRRQVQVLDLPIGIEDLHFTLGHFEAVEFARKQRKRFMANRPYYLQAAGNLGTVGEPLYLWYMESSELENLIVDMVWGPIDETALEAHELMDKHFTPLVNKGIFPNNALWIVQNGEKPITDLRCANDSTTEWLYGSEGFSRLIGKLDCPHVPANGGVFYKKELDRKSKVVNYLKCVQDSELNCLQEQVDFVTEKLARIEAAETKTTAGTRKEVVVAALKKQLGDAQHALVKRKKQMKTEGDSILQDAAVDFLGLRSADVDSLQDVFDEIDVKDKGYIRLKDFFTSMDAPRNPLYDAIFYFMEPKFKGKITFAFFLRTICTFCMFGADELTTWIYVVVASGLAKRAEEDGDVYHKKGYLPGLSGVSNKTGAVVRWEGAFKWSLFADDTNGKMVPKTYKNLLHHLHAPTGGVNLAVRRSTDEAIEVAGSEDGPISLEQFRELIFRYPAMLTPLLQFQTAMRTAFMGLEWWGKRRSVFSEARSMLLEQFERDTRLAMLARDERASAADGPPEDKGGDVIDPLAKMLESSDED